MRSVRLFVRPPPLLLGFGSAVSMSRGAGFVYTAVSMSRGARLVYTANLELRCAFVCRPRLLHNLRVGLP